MAYKTAFIIQLDRITKVSEIIEAVINNKGKQDFFLELSKKEITNAKIENFETYNVITLDICFYINQQDYSFFISFFSKSLTVPRIMDFEVSMIELSIFSWNFEWMIQDDKELEERMLNYLKKQFSSNSVIVSFSSNDNCVDTHDYFTN